jgi:iron complex outermembrane receptor protein
MKTIRVAPWLASALLATSCLAAAPAFAADQPAVDAADKDIVVTAQRRRENVQNVNIAVTALSGDALVDKKITRAIDLQTAAPGLTISRSGVTDSFNIRGIGLASARRR